MSFAPNSAFLLRSTAAGYRIPIKSCAFPILSRVTSTSIFQYNAKVGRGSYDEIHKTRRVAVAAIQDIEGLKWDHNPEKPMNPAEKETEWEKIRQLKEQIRWMMQNMEDGEISVSPYDTAWVALVEDIGGNGQPQFPTSLDWISNNQLADGSWGDRKFLIYDRILNTLACVVALTAWAMHPQKCHKGLRFIRENIGKLEDEKEELMPVGFEVALPSLIETAKELGVEIAVDSPAMKNIFAMRDLKLKNIPMHLVHKKPTPLLFSLEGMKGLVWEKLLNFRAEGSFLSSPSSTAYALRHTKDELSLRYLLNAVKKFDGGVPNAYPVDTFEHMWSVDRLQRLGISRFFKEEIKECIDYVSRYWTNRGICWARNMNILDIDCTSMGFRLLRLHGHDVSIDAFELFEKAGEFCCIPGQSTHAITGMYNLYRASQLMFPHEDILSDAKNYAANFLHEKRLDNALVDKWIITKDLPGEVGYALDVPFYASLPRLEARFFLEQYGGDDDVWIGKTLYRMLYVNSDTYLELAKLDYKICQSVHQLEWTSMQKWYKDCNLNKFGLSPRSLLLAYYLAASTTFEPEKFRERMAWTKTTLLVATIGSLQLSDGQKREFVDEFNVLKNQNNLNGERYKPKNKLVCILLNTVTELAKSSDTNDQLTNAWQEWLKAWEEGGNQGKEEARLLLCTLHLSSGLEESSFLHPKYNQLLETTCKVCHHLRLYQDRKRQVHDHEQCKTRVVIGTTYQIEAGMQELVRLVFTKTSQDLPFLTKQSFFDIARSFYYTAYCDSEAIDSHIDKVLFGKNF